MDAPTTTRVAARHEARKCRECGRFLRSGEVFRFRSDDVSGGGAWGTDARVIWHDNQADCKEKTR